MKDKCTNVTEYVTALCYLMIVESNTQICEVLKMKKILVKILSIVMLLSMCCSMMSLVALAETTTTTDADGNTVVTETTVETYVSAEGDNPAKDGEVTTLEVTVTTPDDQLLSESGSKTGTVVTVTEEKGNPETTEGNGSALPAPTVSDVSKSELEVSLKDENGDLQYGKELTDSVTPKVDTAKDDYNNIDEETGLGSAQETSTNGNKTTVITTEKTQSSVTSEPVVTTPEDGLTRSEVTETTTAVETVTTQTVVVTDRELIAKISDGAATSSANTTPGELSSSAVKDLNKLLTDMGVVEDPLADAVAEKVLEGLASGTVPSDDDAKEIVEDLLDKDMDATVTKTESKIEESAAPSIVVSDVKFTVGEKSGEGASAEAGDDVYTTDISFTVVVTTDVAGTTKVTVFDENNNEIASETVDTSKNSHTLSGLQLTEGMNYNLKFDFSATKDLGADTYVYRASVQTHVEGTGKPENDNNGGNGNGNGNHGNGNGSTKVNIHYMSGLGESNSTFEIIDPNKPGITYTGTLNGSNLSFDMGTTDNGFSFPPDGSYVLKYVNIKTGETGEIILTHKEGNATGDITTEPDAGTNNFNGAAYRDKDVEYSFSYNKTQELSASESITLSFNVNEATEEHSSSYVTTTTVDTKATVTEKWDKSWDNKYEIEEPEEQPEQPVQPVQLMYIEGEAAAEEEEKENVPLAHAASTGSITMILAAAAAASGLGLAGLALTSKRKDYDPKR